MLPSPCRFTMYPHKRDIGWMCHIVPVRKKGDQPKPAPPISDIPMIGLRPECPEEFTGVKPYSNFRPTDTPLIRLAKMGGRKDLLCFRENDPNRGYVDTPPRCQWYYLEDNALNDLAHQAKREDYSVMVPSYMHYQGCEKKKDRSLTQAIPDGPWPDPVKHPKKGKQPRMNDNRPGYSKYNKKVYPLSIAKRDYIIPNPVRFPKVSALF